MSNISSKIRLDTAWIVLTYDCNRNCNFCYLKSDYEYNSEKQLLTENVIFNSLENFNINSYVLIGGEPLIVNNLENVILKI